MTKLKDRINSVEQVIKDHHAKLMKALGQEPKGKAKNPEQMLTELLKRDNVKTLQTYKEKGPILRMKGIIQSYFMKDSEIYAAAMRARKDIQTKDDILAGL